MISTVPEINENNDSNDDVRRVLRPRENIKPALKYGFDEAFVMSDNFQEVYDASDSEDIKNAKVTELQSWKVHGVYKEVDMLEATSPS